MAEHYTFFVFSYEKLTSLKIVTCARSNCVNHIIQMSIYSAAYISTEGRSRSMLWVRVR